MKLAALESVPCWAPHEPTRASNTEVTAPSADPASWVEVHGDYLYAYALLRLRHSSKAEDAVQETFLAALKSGSTYAGLSAERGWLLGILKHKIYDQFRKAGQETSFTDLNFYEHQERDQFAASGLMQGEWLADYVPSNWAPTSVEQLDREEFWNTFRQCANKLPRTVSQVFLLRELDGLETREICSLLNITENNVWVMLHRARMALRRCLELNWFSK